MSDQPKPFTETQRELFQTVAKLNRVKPDDFAEADRWIDIKPPTAIEEKQRYRKQIKNEIAQRRNRKDRSWLLDVPGQMAHDWRRWIPKDDHYRQEKARVLTGWRRDRARTIRYALEGFAERIREEAEHGPLRPYELIDFKARELLSVNLDFDSMNPQRKARFGRRVLRIVWILTDTADLTATKLTWLREWKWGEFESEFLVLPGDGPALPVPRLWSRASILDRDLDEWEQLTRDALRALEEAEPGATMFPDPKDAQGGNGEPVNAKTPLKEPCTDAFAAYRAHKILGKRQHDVATELRTNQGQVSRWVNEVAEWIIAGNVLPDLPDMTTKAASIDPEVIEMGERQDRRTKRQRGKADDDE